MCPFNNLPEEVSQPSSNPGYSCSQGLLCLCFVGLLPALIKLLEQLASLPWSVKFTIVNVTFFLWETDQTHPKNAAVKCQCAVTAISMLWPLKAGLKPHQQTGACFPNVFVVEGAPQSAAVCRARQWACSFTGKKMCLHFGDSELWLLTAAPEML